MVVLAGPGAGKTRVITQRVASLIEEGVPPESVVAVTFTTKAAGELRDRLAGVVPAAKADRVRASTFHSLGLQLLRRFGDCLGIAREPVILDSAQQRRLLREQVSRQSIPPSIEAGGWEPLLDRAQAVIDQLRHRGISAERALARVETWRQRCVAGAWAGEQLQSQRAMCERFAVVAELFAGFERECARRGWLTIDHLISTPTRLLREHKGIAAIVRGELRHLVVDEYQDVNAAQIELLTELAPWSADRPPDLCVVGDDDQAIYGFRGADERAFFRFRELWPGHETVVLAENYRSVPGVVVAGNSIVSRSGSRFEAKKLVVSTRKADGREAMPVRCVELARDADEAGVIAQWLLLDRAKSSREAGGPRPWSSYAVVARTHGTLDQIAHAMALEGIPTRGGRRGTPRDDEGVKDLFAWIEVLIDPAAMWAWRRLLLRPPIGVQADRLLEWEKAYQASRSRARLLGEDYDGEGGAWLEYLKAKAGEVDGLRRLLDLHERVLRALTGQSADRAMMAIIQTADLAHADLLAGRARVRRVADLVAVVRFVRSRVDRLDPPGDLAAWKRYEADLSGREADFDEISTQPGEPDDELAGDGEGVMLLTAHGSKGLEFDTVIVPRVSPPHGYPKTSGPASEALPEGIDGDSETGARGGAIEAERDPLAEERRVLYVACTRARQRLVLLAKKNKSPSKSTHYFEELTREPAGSRLVAVVPAEQIEREALSEGIRLVAGQGAAADLEHEAASRAAAEALTASAERERRRARQEIAEAIASIERVGVSAAELGVATDRVREAMEAIALSVSIQSGAPVPAWAAGRDGMRQVADRLARVRARTEMDSHSSSESKPLRLSYTAIRDYLDCPGCYYLKHVLRLSEPMGEELIVGVAVHGALEQFWREARAAEAEGRFVPGREGLIKLGRDRLAASAATGQAVSEAASRRVEALLAMAYESDREAATRGNVLEIERSVRFAYEARAPGDQVGSGVMHMFEAKIDRVDQLPDGRLCVIDYKTGRPSSGLVEPKADDLQMGVYAMAAMRLFERSSLEGLVGEYRVLQTGERGRIEFSTLKMEKVRSTIDGAIAGIVAGRFVPKDGHDDRPCAMLRE
jgi:DNA helicase II / ATP-dependent DNA helicase PcrA